MALFQRPDADLQYLSLVAGSALEKKPESLLLFVSPTDMHNSMKGQMGVFLLAGPAGDAFSSMHWHALVLSCCAFAMLLVLPMHL